MDFVLNTGDKFEVKDTSTPGCIILVCDDKTAKKAQESVTNETIKSALLGDEKLTDYKLESISVGETTDEQAFVTISLVKKTEMEVLLERVAEQDAALIELAGMIAGGTQ